MEYTALGRTALKVSRLCLGTMNFGPETSEADSHAIMDRALDLGINFFDTADVYGWRKGEGYTEQIIGRWLAQGGGRRQKIVLATKLCNEMGAGPNDRGLSARHIRMACDDSLKRLRTDWIDLYQMHHIDRSAPVEEIWQAMDQLVAAGKVLYVGSSNFAGWHIARTNEAARRRNGLGLVSEQCKYSLQCRHVELEVLPACRDYSLGVIPWGPLAGGFLGGVLGGRDQDKKRRLKNPQRIDRYRAQLEQWESLCSQLGHEPADVALAWLLANPAVTAPIIGPRTLQQLENSLLALEVKLSPETMQRLDTIWPPAGHPEVQPSATGPHRLETPEAFAW